ncbi:hypothetical protein [Streptomyces cyaneofuscatus]|uniref:hypothetical protein n=1 Tax=Streptomyces cyaneofuscatus TaxID=66883 RepID=UPI00342EA28F
MTAVTAMTATASSAGAAAELRTALREAGLHVGATGADDHVQLSSLKAADARQLARLIRTGTKRTLKAARALREICEAYGVGLPELRVRQGRITLGACRVDDAFRLARLLGASSPVPDVPDVPDADAVRDLLAQAFPAATGGGTLDVSVREEAPDVVELGALDARTARRLIGALRF